MRFNIEGRTINQHGTRLGLQGDNKVEMLEFIMPKIYENVDLSEGMAFVLFSTASGVKDFIPNITKTYEEENMVLTWLVGAQVTQEVGALNVEIKISGLADVLWHSEITMFQVGRSILVDSPQVPAMRSKARMADPDKEPFITVVERKIMIPNVLQNIAVQNDENSETVLWKLPRYFDGHDLSKYSVFLKTIMPQNGGRDDIPWSNTTIDSSAINWHWTLKPPQTSFNGKMELQVYVIGTTPDGKPFKWETDDSASVNIMRSLDAEPTIPTSPSIMDDFLKEIAAIAAKAKASETNSKASEKDAAGSAADAANSAKAAAGSAANAKVSEEESKKSETASAGSLTDIVTGLAGKLPISEANQMFKSVSLEENTGIFTFTRYDGTNIIIDTRLEQVVADFRIDENTLELVLRLADGTEQRVALSEFMNLYAGDETTTIQTNVTGNLIEASIKGNSVGYNLLTQELQTDIDARVRAHEANNASQIRFADGRNMQEKLDSGELNGKDGVSISISGFFKIYVDNDGNLWAETSSGADKPPITMDENGDLFWEII